MILRRGYRRRQMAEAELVEARQETLLLLAAEYPEHEFGGIRSAAPGDDGEDEPGEIGMVEIGDAAPFEPLRLARIGLDCLGHRHPQILVSVNRKSIHINFMAMAENIGRLGAL
jgi:hypothetical protein